MGTCPYTCAQAHRACTTKGDPEVHCALWVMTVCPCAGDAGGRGPCTWRGREAHGQCPPLYLAANLTLLQNAKSTERCKRYNLRTVISRSNKCSEHSVSSLMSLFYYRLSSGSPASVASWGALHTGTLLLSDMLPVVWDRPRRGSLPRNWRVSSQGLIDGFSDCVS